jgi:FkbM family methyltransferase
MDFGDAVQGLTLWRDETLVYDVGLHRGEDTDYYLKLGYRVVAFEADPILAAECRGRFAAEIAAGRLHIVEGAIAPREQGDRLTFFRSSISVWGTVEPDWEARNRGLGAASTAIQVDRVDIEAAFKAFGVPLYLKIDVEGVDRLVLETLGRFPDRPRYLSIESDKVAFARVAAELQLMVELGYTRFKVVQQADVPGSRIETRTLAGETLHHVFPEHSSGPFGADLGEAWLSHADALRAYRRIFWAYRLFGDRSPFYRTSAGRSLISQLERLTVRRLPGWYDTHASL